MNAQPQLLQIALDPQDVVYTPDWVARDMVEHFKPSGVILEPSCGDGAFLKYLPNAEWCEIEKGRDFFAWANRVDWIIGNPPYSVFSKWLGHSFEIADNVCYLIPLTRLFNSGYFIKRLLDWGGIVEIKYYADGAELGFPIRFACGAVWFQRGYTGGTTINIYKDAV
jgi:hypothetical protein